MKPYYEEDGITIFHGDCREVLPGLGTVDAVITDPPYGVNFKDQAWDSEIPAWLDIARIASPLVMFTTAPTTMWDYPRPDWVLCWYRPAAQSRTAMGGFNHWSPVLVYGRPKMPVDSINLHAMANAQASGFEHPCPKPERLMRWLISGTEGVVCDPFSGSGSTLVGAKNLGRKAIGIELEEKYCEIAAKRLSQRVLEFA
jgi:site-specific DNA-methyltransferase (adenine-specific)